jgi:hypothetical protein
MGRGGMADYRVTVRSGYNVFCLYTSSYVTVTETVDW